MNCRICEMTLSNLYSNNICRCCAKEQQYAGKELLTCCICNKTMLDLTHHIIKMHKMKAADYKKKYNVSKLCVFTSERCAKISNSNKGHIRTKEAIAKSMETYKTRAKLGLYNFKKTPEQNRQNSERKKEQYRIRGAEINAKTKETCIRKYGQARKWSVICKGDTKHTNHVLQKIADSVSRTMKSKPELQFNYRLAQKRKNGQKFGGEARFEWCLKQAGYIEGQDYIYNKSVSVIDINTNVKRTYYPDFLLCNSNFIEIDGACHFLEDGSRCKEDIERELNLKCNGYYKFMRVRHEDLFDATYLHKLVEDLKWHREHIRATSNNFTPKIKFINSNLIMNIEPVNFEVLKC